MKLIQTISILIFFLLMTCLPVLGAKAQKVSPTKNKSLKAIYRTGKITLEPVLKLTLDTYPENVRARYLSDIIQFKDRLFIPDSGTHDLKILDLKGKFIKTFGRHGAGPGDTYFPSFACVSLGRIVVYEIGNRRFSYFDNDGKFLKIENPKLKGSIYDIVGLDDGRIIVDVCQVIINEKKEAHEIHELRLFSNEMQYLKTLFSQEEHCYKYIIDNGEPQRLVKPFVARLLLTVLSGKKIVVGFPETYKFKIINIDTGESKTISRPFQREKITSIDKKEYLNYREISNKRSNVPPDQIKLFRDKCEFPEYRPVYRYLRSDSEGNILVLFYDKGEKGNITVAPSHFFDAFDSEGNFISHVQVMNSTGMNPRYRAESNHLWCSDTNESWELEWIKYKVTAYEKK